MHKTEICDRNDHLRCENEGIHKQFTALMSENDYLREARERAAVLADAPPSALPDAENTILELRKVVSIYNSFYKEFYFYSILKWFWENYEIYYINTKLKVENHDFLRIFNSNTNICTKRFLLLQIYCT